MAVLRERWSDDGSEQAKSDWVFIYGPLVEHEHLCFYCGVGLEYPLVYWSGHGQFIGLHPECAQRLALHLAKDGLIGEKPPF